MSDLGTYLMVALIFVVGAACCTAIFVALDDWITEERPQRKDRT